jgi:hypothetical protein
MPIYVYKIVKHKHISPNKKWASKDRPKIVDKHKVQPLTGGESFWSYRGWSTRSLPSSGVRYQRGGEILYFWWLKQPCKSEFDKHCYQPVRPGIPCRPVMKRLVRRIRYPSLTNEMIFKFRWGVNFLERELPPSICRVVVPIPDGLFWWSKAALTDLRWFRGPYDASWQSRKWRRWR